MLVEIRSTLVSVLTLHVSLKYNTSIRKRPKLKNTSIQLYSRDVYSRNLLHVVALK
jgi:hypothetical protein